MKKEEDNILLICGREMMEKMNKLFKKELKKNMKQTKQTTQKISRTTAVDLINNSKGRFITVTFTTKDNRVRTINGPRKNQTQLGNITVYSIKDKGYRSFDPKNLTSLKVNSQSYKVQ